MDVGFEIVLLVPRSDLVEAITSRLAAQNNTKMLLGLCLSGAHLRAEMMQKKQMTVVLESRWWILKQNLFISAKISAASFIPAPFNILPGK